MTQSSGPMVGSFSLHNYFFSRVHLDVNRKGLSSLWVPRRLGLPIGGGPDSRKGQLGSPHSEKVRKVPVPHEKGTMWLLTLSTRSDTHSGTHVRTHICTKREREKSEKKVAAISGFSQIFILFCADLTCWFP